MALRTWHGRKRLLVLGTTLFLAALAVLILGLSTPHPPAKLPFYYAEVTFNAPYAAPVPGVGAYHYESVTYYLRTTNRDKYVSLLNLDGAGNGTWAIIPQASIPVEWRLPCSRGSDVTVWSTAEPGSQQAARAYCAGTFGPGIGQSGAAYPLDCQRRWTEVRPPLPPSNFVSGVTLTALSPSDVWAMEPYGPWPRGGSLAAHFDGKAWTTVPTPNLRPQQFALKALVPLAKNDVWGVGFGRGPKAVIEHYDGIAWTVVPGPQLSATTSLLSSVTRVPGRSELWAVGEMSTASGSNALIEHFDGSTWSLVPSPTMGISSTLNSVSADSENDVWAVGSQSNGKEAAQSLSLHFDGASWSVVGTSDVGGPTYANPLYSVIAISPNDVWAAGTSMASDGNAAYVLIEHYNGAGWTNEQAPDPGLSVLYGLAALSPTDIWAVGDYQHVDAIYKHTLLEHFDGQQWAVVPTPFIDKANAAYTGIVLMSGTSELWAIGVADDAMGKKPATFSRPFIESLTWNCSG
jgi:hypothetical protein